MNVVKFPFYLLRRFFLLSGIGYVINCIYGIVKLSICFTWQPIRVVPFHYGAGAARTINSMLKASVMGDGYFCFPESLAVDGFKHWKLLKNELFESWLWAERSNFTV